MNSRFLRCMKPLAVTAAIAASFYAGRHVPKSEGIAADPESCQMSPADEYSARFVELMARRAIRKNALDIRHDLKAGIDSDLDVGYRFTVGNQGTLRIKDYYVICGKCYGDSELPELIGLLITSEFSLPEQKKECTIEFQVNVPKLGTQELPVIRLPQSPHGSTEL
jgi:hypothetical protein